MDRVAESCRRNLRCGFRQPRNGVREGGSAPDGGGGAGQGLHDAPQQGLRKGGVSDSGGGREDLGGGPLQRGRPVALPQHQIAQLRR